MSTQAITGSGPSAVPPLRFEIAQNTPPTWSRPLERNGMRFGHVESDHTGIQFRPGADLPQKLAQLKPHQGFHLALTLPEGTDTSHLERWHPSSGQPIPDGRLYVDDRTGKATFYLGPRTMAAAGSSLNQVPLALPQGTQIRGAVTW